jgi:hypothetical protein
LDIGGRRFIKQIVTIFSCQNIITTLCGTNISEVEERCNDDDDDNDTYILDVAIDAPNDNDYHEL